VDVLLPAFVVYNAQVTVVVAVAAAADALARAMDPAARLSLWRAVALACCALPLSVLAGPERLGLDVTYLLASAADTPGGGSSPLGTVPPAGRLVWSVLGAGVLARVAWLAAGAIRLRGIRRRSRPAVLTGELEALRADVAPRAECRVSSEIAQPAGFGFWKPVVLLPERFFTIDLEAQRTVACHELLHVARRDWPWILLEETARSVFWFNPAVWWLVERIQESREQLVDRLVIARIPAKRAYMTALLTFADSERPAALATAFLRRRHLRARFRKLAKESVMSQKRLVWTAVVLACVLGATIGAAAVMLPIAAPFAAAPAQDVVEGNQAGVTMPRVVREVKPQYTPEAMRAKIEGTVLMRTVIGTDGAPGDIEITRSLDAEYGLDEQAKTALSQWRFQPGRKDGKPVAVRVTVEMMFTLKK
jgi:TonB family protein